MSEAINPVISTPGGDKGSTCMLKIHTHINPRGRLK